jgi:hypothetical protein
MKSVFFFLLLLGCGGSPDLNGPYLDPKVESLYNDFIAASKNNGITVDPNRVKALLVSFDNIAQEDPAYSYTLGYCQKSPGLNEIVLDTFYWNNTNDLNRKAIFEHEAGHCLLDRQHRLDLNPKTGFPSSLMYPYLVESDEYGFSKQIYDSYNAELFTHLNDWTAGDSIGCKFKVRR